MSSVTTSLYIIAFTVFSTGTFKYSTTSTIFDTFGVSTNLGSNSSDFADSSITLVAVSTFAA